jgi:hypothetical protein
MTVTARRDMLLGDCAVVTSIGAPANVPLTPGAASVVGAWVGIKVVGPAPAALAMAPGVVAVAVGPAASVEGLTPPLAALKVHRPASWTLDLGMGGRRRRR